MKQLRVAVVGLGDIGRYVAGFLSMDPLFRPSVVVDRNEERARNGARRFRFGAWSTEYRDALTDPAGDAIYLGVPHHLHYSMVMAALEAGKPVLCEKPITIEVKHAREIVRTSERTGIPVAVNYQYRYDPAAQRLIRICRSGALGRIRYARCNVPWFRDPSYFDGAAWHASVAESGGGTLLTQASHVVDLALAAAGLPIRRIWGWTERGAFPGVEVEDTAFGTVEFSNGAILQIAGTMRAVPERSMSLEVYAEHGTMVWNQTGRRRFRLYQAPRRARSVGRPALPRSSSPRLPWGIHPLQRSMRGFRLWVYGGAPSLNNAGDAVAVLRVVQGCYESAAAGSVGIDLEES